MEDNFQQFSRRRFLQVAGVSVGALAAARARSAAAQTVSGDLIEGYCSASSVVQGGTLDLHVRAVAPHAYYKVEVYRTGLTDTLIGTSFGKSFIPTTAQDDVTLAQTGCGWPVGCTLKVGLTWPTGLYYIRLTSYQDAAGTTLLGAMNDLGFVVRSAQPGVQSAILLCIADTTYQAYNAWGGRSLYTTPQAITVSFDRPYDNQNSLPVGAGELPFIAWAESKGIALEYCTSADLHTQNILVELFAASQCRP